MVSALPGSCIVKAMHLARRLVLHADDSSDSADDKTCLQQVRQTSGTVCTELGLIPSWDVQISK